MALVLKQSRCTPWFLQVPVIFSSGSLSLTGMGGVSAVLRILLHRLWLGAVW